MHSAPALPAAPAARLWRPRRILVTRAARGFAQGRAIMERAAGLGIDVVALAGDRVSLPRSDDARAAYREAKGTLEHRPERWLPAF